MQVDGRLVQRVAARQAEQVGCDAQGDSPQREGRRLLPFARALPPARRAEGAWCVVCDVCARQVSTGGAMPRVGGQGKGAQLDRRKGDAVQADGAEQRGR